MVPVETILGLAGGGDWNGLCEFGEEIVLSSGMLEIMAEARLGSPCLGSVETGLTDGDMR